MKKVSIWFLLGSLVLAAPAWAQDDTDSAVFRTGLGVTSLKFTDRSASESTHTFGIVDFGVSKSFGGVFVGFDTELPFNQGGTPTNDETVQTSVADFTLGDRGLDGLVVGRRAALVERQLGVEPDEDAPEALAHAEIHDPEGMRALARAAVGELEARHAEPGAEDRAVRVVLRPRRRGERERPEKKPDGTFFHRIPAPYLLMVEPLRHDDVVALRDEGLRREGVLPARFALHRARRPH